MWMVRKNKTKPTMIPKWDLGSNLTPFSFYCWAAFFVITFLFLLREKGLKSKLENVSPVFPAQPEAWVSSLSRFVVLRNCRGLVTYENKGDLWLISCHRSAGAFWVESSCYRSHEKRKHFNFLLHFLCRMQSCNHFKSLNPSHLFVVAPKTS